MTDSRLVQLYVYDLSQGLARQFSMQMVGIQIDAVYHTSIVLGGAEYYYGHGINTSCPGATHHGQPMEIFSLGDTSLPDEIIIEYIDSMRSEYTPESYDLFTHNCNNFTADLAMFLCGRSIPEHIKNLPQTVLQTPFGQMLRPALERQLRPIVNSPPPSYSQPIPAPSSVMVQTVSSLSDFDRLLKTAESKCLIAFFTSATCPPCKTVYPHFEQLAEETGEKAVFIKVDIGMAYSVGERYSIRATPTFITWSKGQRLDTWAGASPTDLKTYVQMMLTATYPVHPHTNLKLPTLMSTPKRSITFAKIPPFDKVTAKLGAIAETPEVSTLIDFLQKLSTKGPSDAPIPDLPKLAAFIQQSYKTTDPTLLFPLIDIFRASLSDPRISGWFAEEKDHATIHALLTHASTHETPYPLHLISLQSLCNLFTTPLFPTHLLTPPLLSLLLPLATASLLSTTHLSLRAAASNLIFNIALHIHLQRCTKQKEVLDDASLVELGVGVVEGIQREKEGKEVVKAAVVALAWLVYGVERGSELADILGIVEAGEVVRGAEEKGLLEGGLAKEVVGLLGVTLE
ncbi:DUF862-domain-containing protein [Ascodesmis nigricans]|uniref:DUF862-domain-containing protein n=1 Tax=Ascodesmis nigricans TaxID=341454 RepID=A0A4S2MI56_9PEZI|nr:DUF862-domain-containing protein [Ascodesmis nigricans]